MYDVVNYCVFGIRMISALVKFKHSTFGDILI